MEKQTLRDKRLRAFVLDRKTGRPLPGVSILATVEMKNGQQISLGVLASDHAGFVSFDLTPLSATSREVEHIWVYRLGDEANRIDVRAGERITLDSGAVPILTDPLLIDLRLPRPQLPSIQGFDPGKCFVSPNSFFTNPGARLGEGGCEILLPSNSATHEFQFKQVIRTKGVYLELEDESGESMRLPCGYVLNYKVTWYPLGHSLGQLVYSLPLAPCESMNLAVIDWSRRDEAMRREDTTFTEELTHNQRRDRLIEETVAASLDEWQGGGSVMTGIAGAGTIGILSLSGALGGSYSSSGGERDLASTNTQKLSDNIAQASRAVRNLRSTVVTQVSQQEREVIQTRTVTNHNHCHALTILYYEVLRHYRVVTECVSKQEVLFVDYDVKGFDEKNAFCNRYILERVLLDLRLRSCFDALAKKRCFDAGIISSELTKQEGDLALEKMTVVVTTGGAEVDDGYRLDIETQSGDSVELLNIGHERNTGQWFPIPNPGTPKLQTVYPESSVRLSDIARIKIKSDEETWNLAHFYAAASVGAQTWILYDDEVNVTLEADDWHPLDVTATLGAKSEFTLTPEELCCVRNLISHLNCHKVYYWNAIWMLEDPNERIYRFKTTNTEAEPFKRMRLWNHIENRAVGAVGDMIAFPKMGSKPEPVMDEEGKTIPPVVNCVTLPVHGVFAEAQLGRCNSCEERDITRFWDWSESPCPERAPEIAPITAESRALQPELQPSAMPSPIVNIVNPPAAPEPTGLAASLSLLATPNIFRDMSGLQEVSDLLQKLSEGTISLAQARQKAKQIQEKQGNGTQGSSVGGTAGRPTSQEQHDQLQVYRNAEAKGDLTSEEHKQMAKGYLENAQYKQVASSGNQEGSPSATQDCRSFTPVDMTTLILNSVEYDPPNQISYFRNWSDTQNVHHFADPASVTCHDPSTIDLLVLHETGNDSIDVSHPTHMINSGLSIHFIVSKQGGVTQHNDVVDYLYHAGTYNERSIGIEFANDAWVSGNWEDPEYPDRRAIEVEWALHGQRYVLPSIDALESLVALVKWILEDPNLHIPPIWGQVMVIPTTGKPGFLMRMDGDQLPLAARGNLSGIVAHQVIGPHADGSFLALYTWLRLQGPSGQGIADPNVAYETAVRLVEQGPVEHTRGLYLIDLSGV